jgi:integrase
MKRINKFLKEEIFIANVCIVRHQGYIKYLISKYCRDTGTTYKSPHCTRRTTASRLSTAGMPLDKIRDILGQTDERTTLGYIYNPNTEQKNLEIMNKALSRN